MLKMPFSAKQIAFVLIAVVLILTAASITGQYYKDFIGDDPFWIKVVDKVDLDNEKNNLPTWYQSSTLLFSSFLLAVIASIRKNLSDKDNRFWFILSAIFLYLSMDEAVAIHEQITLPLREQFHLEGFLYLSWVIPAAIILLGFFLSYLKFLFRLSARTRNLLIVAGAIYVFGAVVLEMLGGKFLFLFETDLTGTKAFTYAILTGTEELFEMLGILLFIYTLLRYLETEAFVPFAVGKVQVEANDRQNVQSVSVGNSYGALTAKGQEQIWDVKVLR